MTVLLIILKPAGTARVVFLFRPVRNVRCIMATDVAGTASAPSVLLGVVIFFPRRCKNPSVLSAAFDAFVTVLVQRGKVFPEIFVHC